MSAGGTKLRSWLNKCLRIEMSDGRVLVGIFLCTDRDANVILGSCTEYLPDENKEASASSYVNDEPRMLGLVMVPGKHIVTISIDENECPVSHDYPLSEPLKKEVSAEDVM